MAPNLTCGLVTAANKTFFYYSAGIDSTPWNYHYLFISCSIDAVDVEAYIVLLSYELPPVKNSGFS